MTTHRRSRRMDLMVMKMVAMTAAAMTAIRWRERRIRPQTMQKGSREFGRQARGDRGSNVGGARFLGRVPLISPAVLAAWIQRGRWQVS